MTESLRTKLLMACAFAKVFMDAADMELRGACKEQRQEAAEQLTAALRTLGQPIDYLTVEDAVEIQRVRSIREEFDRERAAWKDVN